MKRRRWDVTRRHWLGLVGAGAAATTLACGDNERGPAAVAVLEPSSTGFVVAVYGRTTRTAWVEVRRGLVIVTTALLELGDRESATLEVGELEPGTQYTVGVRTDDGIPLGTHTIRTAPRDDDPRPVRLAVSADFDPLAEFDSDLFGHLIAEAPELYVSIGDFPYSDNGPPAQTVAEYRERHAALRASPRVRAMFEAMGVRAIYDDHEFRNNWDTARAADEPERYAAAMQVWDEFFPVPGAPPEVRYRSFRWGAHVEGFLLDCRRFRSADGDDDDAHKTMLGATQLAWLLDALRASTATFKLVFTSIPLDFGNGDDHWASFTTERGVIFDAIVGLTGILFVSGDQHWFASHVHAFGVREIQIGPAARGFGEPGPARPGVLFRSVRYNFGLIEATATMLTMAGVGADGAHFYKQSWTAADLTPQAPRNSRAR